MAGIFEASDESSFGPLCMQGIEVTVVTLRVDDITRTASGGGYGYMTKNWLRITMRKLTLDAYLKKSLLTSLR